MYINYIDSNLVQSLRIHNRNKWSHEKHDFIEFFYYITYGTVVKIQLSQIIGFYK
jgi:hypothetical protein